MPPSLENPNTKFTPLSTPAQKADVLWRFFSGRESVHAVQQPNGIYLPDEHPLTQDVLLRHCEGKRTIGIYPIKQDGSVALGTLDYDAKDHRDFDAKKARMQEAVLFARRWFAQFNCLSHIEFSGRKGYHQWLVLKNPAPAAKVRRILTYLAEHTREELGDLEFTIETFPKQDEAAKFGNPIKVPWGRHRRTGVFTYFVDEDFKRLPDDGVASLEASPPVTEGMLDAIIAKLPELPPVVGHPKDEVVGMLTTPLKVGERRPTLISVAGYLRYRGIPEDVAVGMLLPWAKEAFAESLPDEEVESHIRGIYRRYGEREIPIEDTLRNIAHLPLASQREQALKQLASEMKVSIKALRQDLRAVSTKNNVDCDSSSEFSPEELEEGERLLSENDLLERLVDITEGAGHVGEKENKKALILAGVSIRLEKHTLHSVLKSQAGAGKSFMVRSVLALFPSSVVYILGRITTNALFYLRGKDLSHHILFVDEVAGALDSDYGVRIAISEGELSVWVTTKNPATGQFEVEEVRVPAQGMVFFSTTTRLHVHPEMETRVLDLFIDETEEQTQRILEVQAGDIDEDRAVKQQRVARAALGQLESMQVSVPFAQFLPGHFPTKQVRVRRDFPKLLSLIKASALLYQRQREIKDGRVIASLADYAIARAIAVKILAQTLSGVSPQEAAVLDVINALGDEFSVRDLRGEVAGISYDRLKKIVGALHDKGILSHNGETGWKSRYTLIEDPREELALPSLDELEQMIKSGAPPPPPRQHQDFFKANSGVDQIQKKSGLANIPDIPDSGMSGISDTPQDFQIRKPGGSDTKTILMLSGRGGSEHSFSPCYACGGIEYWQRPDGEWLCSRCHPRPGGISDDRVPMPSSPQKSTVTSEPDRGDGGDDENSTLTKGDASFIEKALDRADEDAEIDF